MENLEINKIHNYNCLEGLKLLEDNSVDCCVTSPPYWGLRDYGTATWVGGDENCDHKSAKEKSRYDYAMQEGSRHAEIAKTTQGTDGAKWADVCPNCGAIRQDEQIGLEKTPEDYVQTMVTLFSEVKRVLKPTGTLWLNLGDTYYNFRGYSDYSTPQSISSNDAHKMESSCGKRNVKQSNGLKGKDLVGIPWMTAFALRNSGWYLRQDIIWHKPNPMPESVTDRCTKSHEYIFLMSKSQKYYFDYESIRTPMAESSINRLSQDIENQEGSDRVPGKTNGKMKAVRANGIVRDRLLDYDSKEKQLRPNDSRGGFENEHELPSPDMANKRDVWTVNTMPYKEAHFATFPEKLIVDMIKAGCPKDGIVLYPFMGAGTTAVVARKLNRNFIGFELNPKYIKIAEKRLYEELGMFL